MADPETHRRGIAKHLEFLGYTCEWQKDGWLSASHPSRWNFFLRPMPVGVLFHCTIQLGIISDEKRLEFLEFFNRINATSFFARFALERDEPNGMFVMRIRTLAPGDYRRRQFGIFMDMWHGDLERLREGPSLQSESEDSADETDASLTVTVN